MSLALLCCINHIHVSICLFNLSFMWFAMWYQDGTVVLDLGLVVCSFLCVPYQLLWDFSCSSSSVLHYLATDLTEALRATMVQLLGHYGIVVLNGHPWSLYGIIVLMLLINLLYSFTIVACFKNTKWCLHAYRLSHGRDFLSL